MRDKIRYRVSRLGNRWDDWLCLQDGEILGWLSTQDWAYYGEGWARALCFLIGHSPIPDHCNIPEHDYCATCMTPTPNLATRIK